MGRKYANKKPPAEMKFNRRFFIGKQSGIWNRSNETMYRYLRQIQAFSGLLGRIAMPCFVTFLQSLFWHK